MKKTLIVLISISLVLLIISLVYLDKESKLAEIIPQISISKLEIPQIEIDHDEDGDGIKDLADILEGARKDVENKPKYKSVYYADGYPPDNEGVCTDVIWRSLMNAGYNLKELIDEDIKNNLNEYPRVDVADPNIDFRRVPNLNVFFKRNATVLTTEIIPYDVDNLKNWQAGDIVVFGEPLNHIAIISDIRRNDGVPYIIHNASPYTMEEDKMLYWDKHLSKIIGHYRWPKIKY